MSDTNHAVNSVLEMDEDEIRQRVNLLKRFRSMLEVQRDRFRDYLNVLEVQEQAIVEGDARAIEAQAGMEQQIVREILSVQKVIKPLEGMYGRMYPGKKPEITRLQSSLQQLQSQVLERNRMNRELLARQRDELKEKIQSLRIPKGRKSVYAGNQTPSMVDLSA
ncbi:hypothetical protein [Salinispira pacifica]|uniref:Flagellar biosynthesis protein FlgN n=1 Tax=Salinispira pacifica TaxID=1307761 RepID=V5WD29_9SPIO|nr:hypothetical protein [Salinispira pacifica]AHC13728.1 hypothetical protein L21SP2_0288 [Salinispira pacifica]